MSKPITKRQMSASKVAFPGYFVCLKNLKDRRDEIQKYIDDSKDVTLSPDEINQFKILKDEVDDFENDPPVFGRNWIQFSSKKAQAKADLIERQLAEYDRIVKFKITTTRAGMRQRLDALDRATKEFKTLGKDTITVVLVTGDDKERKEYAIEVELREVNRGAFGTVHIGMCKELGKEFALKRPLGSEEEGGMIDDDTTRRFLREASIWSTLDHEHILPYWGKVELGDTPHLVSPYIRDGDLLEFLRKHRTHSRPKILHDIASALAYLHGQEPQIIHADVKSSNILIDATGHTYLCDFGLTKLGNTVTTAKGAGTLYWLSPERLDGGESSRTSHDDVYAFGITIAEVLLERIPYESFQGSQSDFITGVMRRNLRPEGGSGPLWDLACKCWQNDPNLRPTMVEVAAELSYIETADGQ